VKRRKRNAELWALRPGDLPPERLAAEEPRLAAMEGNPIFRVVLWRRRVGHFDFARAVWFCGVACLVFFTFLGSIAYAPPWAFLLGPAGGILIWMSSEFRWGKREASALF
jgi:hypothetical protein